MTSGIKCQSSTSRSRVNVIKENAYMYVTNYLHAEIYFWSTRKHTEYALFRSGCSQIGYLVLYAIPPTKASLGESYFRTSTSSEFVRSSEDFYDMDPGGA